MELALDQIDVRVLGSLIEKQITTPEYYPLTLNALTAACNQKSNRDPVLDLDEKSVVRTLDSLRDRGLVNMVSGADMRVPKYRQTFTEKLNLTPSQVGAICVLMLRGPQTVGEIRGRTGRLHAFSDLEEVERTLNELSERSEGGLVVKLPRQVGRKESRYAHAMSGEPEIAEEEREPLVEAATLEVRSESERMERIEAEMAQMRRELDELRQEHERFRQQFE